MPGTVRGNGSDDAGPVTCGLDLGRKYLTYTAGSVSGRASIAIQGTFKDRHFYEALYNL